MVLDRIDLRVGDQRVLGRGMWSGRVSPGLWWPPPFGWVTSRRFRRQKGNRGPARGALQPDDRCSGIDADRVGSSFGACGLRDIARSAETVAGEGEGRGSIAFGGGSGS